MGPMPGVGREDLSGIVNKIVLKAMGPMPGVGREDLSGKGG